MKSKLFDEGMTVVTVGPATLKATPTLKCKKCGADVPEAEVGNADRRTWRCPRCYSRQLSAEQVPKDGG